MPPRSRRAEVQFGVIVDDLQKDATGRVCGVIGRDEHGHTVAPRAALVVGADGIRSVVALAAGAQVTREAAAGGAVVYGYFRGVAAEGYEWAYGARASAGLIPTNDGEVCVFAGAPTARFRSGGQAPFTSAFHEVLAEALPGVARRVAAGEQVGRLRGFAGVRGYYRRPWGPGWALVGDAGHFRDPITTHGISDAFRDAELLARAVDGSSTLAEYEQIRNAVSADLFAVTERMRPMTGRSMRFECTCGTSAGRCVQNCSCCAAGRLPSRHDWTAMRLVTRILFSLCPA